MLADYHVHTEFSNDSIYPMEEVVKDAILLGIKDICFTDHVDYGPYRDWDDPRGIKYRPGDEGEPEQVALTNVDYGKYFSMIEKLREKYKDKIAVKAGMEFGVQTHTIPEYVAVIHLTSSFCPFIRQETRNFGQMNIKVDAHSRSTTRATIKNYFPLYRIITTIVC